MEKRTEELEMKMQAAMEGKAMQVDAEDGDQQVMAKVRDLEEKIKDMRKQNPAMQVVGSKRRATSAGPVEDIGEEKEPVVVIKGLKESMWREDAEILFTPLIDARAGLGTYEMLIREECNMMKVKFGDAQKAKAFIARCKAEPITIKPDGGETYQLKVTWDRNATERKSGYILSRLWEKVEEHLQNKELQYKIKTRNSKLLVVSVGKRGPASLFEINDDATDIKVLPAASQPRYAFGEGQVALMVQESKEEAGI